jgi:hypothetical protein
VAVSIIVLRAAFALTAVFALYGAAVNRINRWLGFNTIFIAALVAAY